MTTAPARSLFQTLRPPRGRLRWKTKIWKWVSYETFNVAALSQKILLFYIHIYSSVNPQLATRAKNFTVIINVSVYGPGISLFLVLVLHLLQFSSSLPSGQSLKPLQRKRPMMQWTPFAQAKKVGAHFDRTLAEDRRRVRGRDGKETRG